MNHQVSIGLSDDVWVMLLLMTVMIPCVCVLANGKRIMTTVLTAYVDSGGSFNLV